MLPAMAAPVPETSELLVPRGGGRGGCLSGQGKESCSDTSGHGVLKTPSDSSAWSSPAPTAPPTPAPARDPPRTWTDTSAPNVRGGRTVAISPQPSISSGATTNSSPEFYHSPTSTLHRMIATPSKPVIVTLIDPSVSAQRLLDPVDWHRSAHDLPARPSRRLSISTEDALEDKRMAIEHHYVSGHEGFRG